VIERKYLGGSCPNIACLPSKNLVHSAKVASYFGRSKEFGIAGGPWRIDMNGVRERKRKMVEGLGEMHLRNFSKSGAEIIMGSGRFVGEKTVRVDLSNGGSRTLRGERVFLDLGTRAAVNDIPGLEEAAPLTHVEALDLGVLPDHLLILGGGFVGLEFAQVFRRFGSRVTVIERSPQLAPREDPDISEGLQQLFHDEGVNLALATYVSRVEGKSGKQVRLHSLQGGSEFVIEGSHLLAATGRVPNTADIGLELAGVTTTERGYIKVNERLETTAPGVWAMGDCAGSPQFTHIGFDDFRVVRDNLAGGHRLTTGRQTPFCLFTDPEFARVGLSETEAKQQGVAYTLLKIPMDSVLRTRTLSETRGFLKALLNPANGQILGFAAFGSSAGELLAPVQLAMSAGLPYTALRDAILTHPTITEGLVALFSAVPAMQAQPRTAASANP
jgi:pyruvate/2-oxoglutarate dehydrogenase complex dihydrolipoamide dehydrogenase (E3) component